MSQAQYRDRIKSFRHISVDLLDSHPKNWRMHPESQKSAMRAVLDEIGWADAILVRDTGDGRFQIIDGHLREELATDGAIPALVLDVDEAEAAKILATHDPLAAMAETNAEALAFLLQSLIEDGDKLSGSVWPDYIIDPLLAADWSPPAVEDMPDREEQHGHKIGFSSDQWETVKAALTKCREDNDRGDELTDGQCVELICQNFLS